MTVARLVSSPAGRMLSMQRSGAFKSDLEVSEGRFMRQKSRFTDWVTADGSSGYRAEPGRYHLYVGRACPWSQRAMIVRHLKGLEDTIGISFVNPYRDERGWAFEGDGFVDDLHGWDFLSEAYRASDPGFDGRVSVPGAVGPRDGPDRQQRLGRRHPDAQQRVGRVGRRRRSTSTPSRCAPRSTRSTPGSTTTSTTASTRPASRARRRPTTRPSTASSRRCRGWRRSSASAATSPATRSPRPTGARGSRCCASTPSTTRTSASTAAA